MLNSKRQSFPGCRQRGMATLTVSVVVLICVTLIVVFATRVGLMDFRMSGNEYRYKEAFSIADAGLEFTAQQFSTNLSPDSGNYIYDPDGDGVEDAIPVPYLANLNIDGNVANNTEARFTANVVKTVQNGVNVYTVTSTGESVDRSGTVTVSQQIIVRGITGGASPDVPVIADGSMDVTGNMHVVANPNGAEDCVQGCATSVWTTGGVAVGNSISTCHIQGFTGGQCPNPALDPLNSQITNGADQGIDIIQNDPYSPAGNFPPDLFAYLFGIPYTEWTSIFAIANQEADCSNLGPNSKGLYWISGDCTINAGTNVGSEANPVVMVIHNSLFKTGGNAIIYGIVFVFDDTPATDGDVPGPDPGGGTVIRGSLIANTDFDGGGSGTFAVVYDPTVLNNIINNSGSDYLTVATVPGSWRDF